MQKQSSKEVKLSCIGLVGARDTWMSKNEGRKGELCKSFQEACIKLGLFEDDSEIEKCLTEAATVKFPKQFRQLYVTLMTQSIASNPRELFEKFKTELSEDFMKNDLISIQFIARKESLTVC